MHLDKNPVRIPNVSRLSMSYFLLSIKQKEKKIKEITAVTTNRGETDFAITLIGVAFCPRKLRSLQ